MLESRGIDRTFLAENLAQVHEAISGRLRPADMEPVHDCMKRAIAALAREAPSDSAPTGDARFDLTRKTYLQAILAGERRAAMGVANEALRQGASTLDLYVEVLQASLYEVGRQWETNKITVAREHAATAITQAVMAHLYDRLDRPGETKKGRLLITGIGGELHSVGALMVADVLESCGWNVRYLGTDLPEEGILDSIREHDPASIGISATMAFNVPVVGRLIEAIRKEHGESKRVMVGGGAFRQGKDLWRQLGADGFARDLRDAIGLFG